MRTGNMPAFVPPANQEQLTEKQFDAQVRDLAAARGWNRIYHTQYSIGSDRGYPDLTLVHPRHGALWLEVKGRRGRPSLDQVLWVQDLRRAGFHAYVVYPKDIELVDFLLRGDSVCPLNAHGDPCLYLEPLLANEEKTR